MLWEMLSFQMPWLGKDNDTIIASVVAGKRPPIPSMQGLDTGAPKGWFKLMHECWHQDPHLRPEFSTVLDKLLQIKDAVESEERSAFTQMCMHDEGLMLCEDQYYRVLDLARLRDSDMQRPLRMDEHSDTPSHHKSPDSPLSPAIDSNYKAPTVDSL